MKVIPALLLALVPMIATAADSASFLTAKAGLPVPSLSLALTGQLVNLASLTGRAPTSLPPDSQRWETPAELLGEFALSPVSLLGRVGGSKVDPFYSPLGEFRFGSNSTGSKLPLAGRTFSAPPRWVSKMPILDSSAVMIDLPMLKTPDPSVDYKLLIITPDMAPAK